MFNFKLVSIGLKVSRLGSSEVFEMEISGGGRVVGFSWDEMVWGCFV